MKKRAKKSKAKKAAVVQEVVLPAAGVVRVVAPPGVMPVVAVDPVRRVIEIAPVKKKRRWWQF